MQLLASIGMEGSEGLNPNGTEGLSLIPGCVKSLRELGCNLSVPHVGWNEINAIQKMNHFLITFLMGLIFILYIAMFLFQIPMSILLLSLITEYQLLQQ